MRKDSVAEGGGFELSLYFSDHYFYQIASPLCRHVLTDWAGRRIRGVRFARPSGISNRPSIFQAAGLQRHFARHARYLTGGPFSVKKGTATVAFREFGSERRIVAVDLIL